MQKPLVIAIVGPTASGKSALALKIAQIFRGEIVSADSRQVYRGLDLGTGKVTARERRLVPHHLIDVADPKRQFSVAEFKTRADHAIQKIFKRGKIPILVGGTGFWIDTIAFGRTLPAVPPNDALRKRLARTSAANLLMLLQKIDPQRARTIETKNPRRLIRAIEIARALGRVPPLREQPRYRVLWLGVHHPPNVLRGRIAKRLKRRLAQGMIQEGVRLKKRGLSWKRFYELGLEYRFLADFLRGRLTRQEMERQLERAIRDYAKRQIRWFSRNKRIYWIRNSRDGERLIRKSLNFSGGKNRRVHRSTRQLRRLAPELRFRNHSN